MGFNFLSFGNFYRSIPKKTKSMWEDLKPIDFSKIETIQFSEDQYIKVVYPKTQICCHHTVSGDGVNGDISSWEGTPERVATCIIIDRSGTPWQLFSSKFFAYHLGTGNTNLDKHSIGIEIDNWGALILGDGTVKQFGKNADGTPKMVYTTPGRYYAYYGNPVYVATQYYPDGFRGYNYYEKYTEAQIRTAGELILYWNKVYNIPLDYNSDMWDVSPRALRGEPGIWTHVSYRPAPAKTDCHPQENLIEMLKTLSKI